MLYDKLLKYRDSDYYPFHMPGHKRKNIDFANPYEIDITEIDGFDNLHDACNVIKQSQKMAADLYGARESFYLINGSTCGILSAIFEILKINFSVFIKICFIDHFLPNIFFYIIITTT